MEYHRRLFLPTVNIYGAIVRSGPSWGDGTPAEPPRNPSFINIHQNEHQIQKIEILFSYMKYFTDSDFRLNTTRNDVINHSRNH